MDPFHFACPHCSSRLRVREKLYLGRHIDCPECRQTLLIVEGKEGLGVERIEPRAAAASNAVGDGPGQGSQGKIAGSAQQEKPASGRTQEARSAPIADAKSGTSPGTAQTLVARPMSGSFWRRPMVLTGSVVAVLITVLIVLVFRPLSKKNDGRVDDPAQIASNAGAGQESPLQPDDQKVPRDSHDVVQPHQPRDEVGQRFTRIGDVLLEHVLAEKSFPAGTVPNRSLAPERRLSWMAILADRLGDDPSVSVAWDRAWDNPQNDLFVRRRIKAFQNPAIGKLTGDDGYPATHFVGVAGVGADAAALNNRHARSGIFGHDRRTRLEDIRDGASNTLLVLGVREHLGSWAAGGISTVRGLANEPYVNGPDGFGTGSADSMLVLTADGRVLSVSAATDPKVLRRMAAKADGLPLDESEPGEPGDGPSLLAGGDDTDDELEMTNNGDSLPRKAVNAIGMAGAADADDRPLEPEFSPEPIVPPKRRVDLALSLKQPIASFDQPRSKPLAEILVSVAEMAGARIAFDQDELGAAASRLSEPTALKLEHTTVGEILSGLLRPAGLAFRIEGDHLRVVPGE